MRLTNNKLVLLLILSSALYGVDTPNIADVERNITPPKEVTKKTAPLVEIGGIKKYEAPLKSIDGQTIFVKGFNIDGAIHVDKNMLLQKIASYTNKDLTFSDLQEVTSIITKVYRDQGYFVSRAYIPVQDMKNGIVTISIIEGNYGKFILKNNSLVKDSVIQGMIDDAKRDNIVSTYTLERAMLIINETPGAVVTVADVMPGEKVGTSDFAITTEATKRYDGYILADNYGGRYIGKNRLMAGINLNSPFRLGDKISFSGLISNGSDLKNGRVAYSLPLMSNGLTGEVGYSITTYSLVEEYTALDATGYAKTLDAKFTYPFIKTTLESLNVSLYLASRALKDEIRSTSNLTEKSVKSGAIEINYDNNSLLFKKFDSQTILGLIYTYGNLKFKDDAKRIADEAGANTNGNYSKILITAGEKVVMNSSISVESSIKFQHSLSNKNLDGSEDFSIGGNNGVKLYPDGEISAENGYLFSIEAKYKLPNFHNSLSNQFGVFYDQGHVYMADSSKVTFTPRTLKDVGVGYYGRYKDFFLNAQLAYKIDNENVTSEPDRNYRALFQGGWVF